mgnify:CR=1 FL=1
MGHWACKGFSLALTAAIAVCGCSAGFFWAPIHIGFNDKLLGTFSNENGDANTDGKEQ